MKEFISGLIVGLAVAAFAWWLQNKTADLYWTTTATRFEPLAAGQSEFAGMGMYSLKVTNYGNATATNVNIEIDFPQAEIMTANLHVPEHSAVRSWTEIPTAAKKNSLNLQYSRLLPNDEISIGCLLKGEVTVTPSIAVKSDLATGIPYELVEQHRKRVGQIVRIVLTVLLFVFPLVSIWLLRFKGFRRVMERLTIPMEVVFCWIGPHEARISARARRLMRRAEFNSAVRVLQESSDPYNQLLLARCYSVIGNSSGLRASSRSG